MVESASFNPHWAFGAEDVPLWAATMATSAGIEHRELLHRNLVLNKYRSRGHTIILKWVSFCLENACDKTVDLLLWFFFQMSKSLSRICNV